VNTRDECLILTDYVSGYVHEVGSQVTRFKKGDRVLSVSAFAVRNDYRFGTHQRYTLSTESLTAKASFLHLNEIEYFADDG
jgi:NADPH:quinone reductase-like Zn-dependent oxidoreductase